MCKTFWLLGKFQTKPVQFCPTVNLLTLKIVYTFPQKCFYKYKEQKCYGLAGSLHTGGWCDNFVADRNLYQYIVNEVYMYLLSSSVIVVVEINGPTPFFV